MGNYTIFQTLENPTRGRQARNLTSNVPKILYLKSSSEQIFSKNCRWVPLCSEMNEASPQPVEGYFFLLSYSSCSHIFWFEFLEQSCFSMLFLLNSLERFGCTVQQSKAKANKHRGQSQLLCKPTFHPQVRRLIQTQELNQSVSIHFHDVQQSAVLTTENKSLRIYALGSVHDSDVGTGPNCCRCRKWGRKK